ncbi:putative ABC transporter [Lasiosphaeria ovina]|uniref:ABC transporter n=1 Tax=Lasiosphaeria ovina TaxID=92902 RepID=A0AAE0MY48_9PEZI|nr:putative ABC transporter [Lasiosphaeria ovina]
MAHSDSEDVTGAPEIIASRQQTRFHLLEDARSSDVTIEQLTLSIRASKAGSKAGSSKAAKAGKAKAGGGAAAKTRDILVDATLRLKAGVHFGLLGRNGSGKSTLLRALAAKVIPGLSLATRIVLLQQTAAEDGSGTEAPTGPRGAKTVMQYILEGDEARNQILEELNTLTRIEPRGDNEELGQLRAYRRLLYTRIQRQRIEAQKNAALRSGARGSQARKELIAFEKRVEEARDRVDNTEERIDSKECQDELAEASRLTAELQTELDERPLGDLEARARKVLSALGFTDEMMQKRFDELSGGWQMRCMLANTLLQDADIMILDEPTNFLDLLGIIWLQKYLIDLRTESSKTIIVVSHDRDFIDHVCQEIIMIKDQNLEYFDGNLTTYEEDQQSKRVNLTRLKNAQEKQIAHVEKTIANNIRAGKKSGDENKLRQAVSRQKKLEDRMGMQTNAKGGRFKLSRDMAGYHTSKRAAIEIPPEESAVAMTLPLAPDLRFPGALVSLDHVWFSYKPEQASILQDVSLSIEMGSRVGIVGLNGSGKSTLVKLVTEVASPTKGTVTRHPRVKIGYYSQLAVEDLRTAGAADPSMTALSTLAAEAGKEMDESDMRGLLASFHLKGDTASAVPVAKLSGGQLVRLALACIIWKHPHLLVLDEVTTHLDFYTVQALGRALRGFNGALLLVSHDRFFVKSVIEGAAELMGSDEEDEGSDAEEQVKAEMKRNLYLMKKGKLTLLANGVRDFEESLESRVDKLLAA